MSTKITPRVDVRKEKTAIKVRYKYIHEGYRIGSDGSVWTKWEVKVIGRPGEYRVGSRFICCLSKRWRQLKTFTANSGYRFVSLSKAGVKQRYVHHLVLETFVGPRPPGAECRHLDGDKTDNRLENLAWGTKKENAADRLHYGNHQYGEKNPASKFTQEEAETIRRLYSLGEYRQIDLAEMYGVGQTCISKIVRRRSYYYASLQE